MQQWEHVGSEDVDMGAHGEDQGLPSCIEQDRCDPEAGAAECPKTATNDREAQVEERFAAEGPTGWVDFEESAGPDLKQAEIREPHFASSDDGDWEGVELDLPT